MTTESDTNSICCPKFNPAPWDDKMVEWENKKFIKDSVCTFFYMPLTFSKVMKRLDEKVRAAGAEMPDFVCLSDHTSKWNMDVYLAVDKDIPAIENFRFTGRFFSKVYEGSFKDTNKWCKDYEYLAKQKGLTIKKMFLWYTTCPKCAKKYGKNYVVIIGQTE